MKATIFDLDGTLTSFEARYVDPIRDALLSEVGYIPYDLVDEVIEKLLVKIGEKSKFLTIKVFWTITNELDIGFIDRIKFLLTSYSNYKKAKHDFYLLPGAYDSLRLALDHGKVAIVTSTFRADVEKAIQKYPIIGEVDAIITNDDVKNPKPSPEPLLSACQMMNVSPFNAIYIGDLPTDIIAAHQAEMESIAFRGEFAKYTTDLLKEQKPNHLVNDHDDIQQIISNHLQSIHLKV